MNPDFSPREQLKAYSFEGQVLLLYTVRLTIPPNIAVSRYGKQSEKFLNKGKMAFSRFVEKTLFQEAREVFVRQHSPWGSPWEAIFLGKLDMQEESVAASFDAIIRKGEKLYTQSWKAAPGSSFGIQQTA